MGSEWRQKGEHELTPELLAVRHAMDAEWKEGCDKRGAAFYLAKDGSRRVYTQKEFDEYTSLENELWLDWEKRAKEAGLYAEISLEDQITEKEAHIAAISAELSTLRMAKSERDIAINKEADIKRG